MSQRPRAVPPPAFLLVLLVVSSSLTLFTAGFAFHYTRTWSAERRGEDIEEQRKGLSHSYFSRKFIRFVEDIERLIPEDASVLLEPKFLSGEVNDLSGNSRWFLFLNYYAYPRRFYTRQSQYASGTLVDYQKWVEHHWELYQSSLFGTRLAELLEIERRQVEWKIRLPMTSYFDRKLVEIYRWDPELQDWQQVQLEVGP